MKFLLQQGWGMLALIDDFLREHEDSGVILSPRVCDRDQMEKYVKKFKNHGNAIFFDPQFYEPRTDLDRILSFPYWEDYDFQTGSFDAVNFCKRVIEYEIEHLNVDAVILPGRYTNSVDNSWLEMQYKIAETGSSEVTDRNVFTTLALGPDVILNQDNFDTVIDELINYPVQGVYFVFEHPNNEFLINNELFLYAILDSTLSIVLSGKEVIVGYANQQSLIFAASGIETIASGNYRNVRSFDHMLFSSQDTEGWQRNIWYFDGNTLGEYQPPKLSLAFRRGLASYFGPSTSHSKRLLEATNPANVPWREPEAFRHYLELIKNLWTKFEKFPKNQRAYEVKIFLEEIREHNNKLREKGFNPGERGFYSAIESTIDALDAFMKDRKSDIENL